VTAEVISDNVIMLNTDKWVIPENFHWLWCIKIVFLVPEGLLLVVWSRLGYGLWVGLVCGSKVFTLRWVAMGWVGLKKLDPRTTLTYSNINVPNSSNNSIWRRQTSANAKLWKMPYLAIYIHLYSP